jgi:GNAT superfamily N-acetyltransferase
MIFMKPVEFRKEEFAVSTDPARIQVPLVHHYLSCQSYWAQGRSIGTVSKSVDHSLCFGVYHHDSQVGFARVITDYAVFAYILDLFIIPEFQGQGLGKWLMSCILAHPDLQGPLKWVLTTRDAHGLYSQYEFKKLEVPGNWMELKKR